MEIKPDIPKCEINGTEHSNCAENKAITAAQPNQMYS